MSLAQLFVGFLQPVALGAGAVFALLLFTKLSMPRRKPVLITRRRSR